MTASTVYSVLEQTAERWGDRPALHQGDRVYTWNEFRQAARETAAGLRSLGFGKGTIIGLASDASAEFYFADIGILANGSVAAALYTSYPASELTRTLVSCDARAVFIESPALYDTMAPQIPEAVIPILLKGEREGVMTLDELRERGRTDLQSRPKLPEVAPKDHAILYLTSGATGEPKMGLVTHHALVSNINMGPKVLDLGPDSAVLAFLSPAHIMQRLVVELLPMLCGTPVWFAESLMKLPQAFLMARPTLIIAPPRLWERVHASIRTEIHKRGPLVERAVDRAIALGREAARLNLAGKRLAPHKRLLLAAADRLFFRKMRARFGGRLEVCASGSAPLGRELAEFYLAIGMPMVEGYGLTEGGVVAMNPRGRMKPGSIGKPLPGVEARIAEDGELLFRSAASFSGYYGDPVATAEVLRDGWLHTGDIGEIDDEGYIFITGRKKEIIVASNGRKVYPSRIEALFRMEPIVSNVLLVGEGRPHVTALITVNTAYAEGLPRMAEYRGKPPAEVAKAQPVVERLRDAVRRVNSKLADFEQIRKYRVLERDFSIDHGELTATMKVRRERALENFRAAVDGLYAARD